FDAHVGWALIPLALFAFGWALNVPVVTLMVLDLFPTRRGMASSLQAVVASVANGLVAGVIAPVVMHSTVALAATSLAMLCVGLFVWLHLRRRGPDAASVSGGAPPPVWGARSRVLAGPGSTTPDQGAAPAICSG